MIGVAKVAQILRWCFLQTSDPQVMPLPAALAGSTRASDDAPTGGFGRHRMLGRDWRLKKLLFS